MIRKYDKDDWKALLDIYNYYIRNSVATFDEIDLTKQEMQDKMAQICEKYPCFVYCNENDEVVGFAYASDFNKKSAYRFTVEATIYINPSSAKKGIGSMLFEILIDALRVQGIKTVISLISLPNEGSIKLHKKLGFEEKTVFKEIGYKNNLWIDVCYMEKKL